jgi:nitroreductase
MQFHEVIRKRRSIRGYQSQSVPQEKLDRVWEAVRLAPSACNFQPVRFLLVESAAARATVCECYKAPWLREAPLIVVVLGSRERAWKRVNGTSAHPIDAAIAMEHLVLAAAAEGLGTCWVCAFDQEALHARLKLPPEWEVVALTPLGYPAAEPKPLERKPVSELVQVL